MITDQEYALLANDTYKANPANLVTLPVDWARVLIPGIADLGFGFSASVYKKGTEYVVAFRGSDGTLKAVDMAVANAPGVTGFFDKQIQLALVVIAKLQKQEGLTNLDSVSFTGHSLGGGLASVVGTFFNCKAVTFEEAPFENSAVDSLYIPNAPFNIEHTVAEYFDNYIKALSSESLGGTYIDADFTSYVASWYTSRAAGLAAFGAREVLVTDHYVLGGPVVILDTPATPAIASSRQSFDIGYQGLIGSFARHDMRVIALLTASSSLDDAFRAHSSLLQLLRDDSLYDSPSESTQTSLAIKLLRDHYAQPPSSNNVIEKFALDLLKIQSTGALGVANSGHKLENGVIAALMEYYFYKDVPAGNFINTVAVANGIQFDLSMIPTWDPPGPSGPLVFDGRGGRGISELIRSLPGLGNDQHQAVAGAAAWAAPLWTIQSGASGLITAGAVASEVQVGAPFALNFLSGGGGNDVLFGGDAGNALQGDAGNDKLFGGSGVDSLVGGGDDDYLVGGDGIDTLIGGTGSDQLFGGVGQDIYEFFGGDGNDTITDADGGLIKIAGQSVAGVAFTRVGVNAWKATLSSGEVFVGVSTGASPGTYTVVLRNANDSLHLVINDWSVTNNFGLGVTPGGAWTPTPTGTDGSSSLRARRRSERFAFTPSLATSRLSNRHTRSCCPRRISQKQRDAIGAGRQR
jgi:RTX calcium-binding nonapeptide repeat (4 copies)